MIGKFKAPRVVWLMVPAGEITDTITTRAAARPGGYHHRRRQFQLSRYATAAAKVAQRKIHYVDSGTSGGVWGLAEGYSLMIGGDKAVVEQLRPIFETLAPAR